MGEPVTLDEARRIGYTALLVGPARALGLLRRMPELFTARGWPHYDDALAIAVGAVSCVKVGAGKQRWRMPQRAAMLGDKWRELVAFDEGKPTAGKPTSEAIVELLDLQRLLEP